MFDGVDTNTPAVSPTLGQKLGLVYSCLNVLGETVGSLPFNVKRYAENGSTTEYAHPVYRLIHDRPNPYMTSFDFWSTIEKVRHIWGNAYVLIDRDIYYEPIGLYPIPSWEVTIEKTTGGAIFYKWREKVIQPTEILHFKNYSTDGIGGVSTITQNQLTVGLGLKLKTYNSTVVSTRPPGYLTSENRPKDEQQKEQQKKMWNAPSESEQSKTVKAGNVDTTTFGRIPLLYGGVKYVALTLPADQVAYIDSTELNDRDILGMFRMPPTMVSIYKDAPYNSSEQQDIAFVKYTLASLRQYEQECTEKLFPVSNQRRDKAFYCKFSLNGILRGDMKARREFYASGIQNGWLTPKMAAEFEDLVWVGGEEGNNYYLQGALVPMKLIEDFVMSKANKQENQPDNQQSQNSLREQIRGELRDQIKGRMNGHYKEIADILED